MKTKIVAGRTITVPPPPPPFLFDRRKAASCLASNYLPLMLTSALLFILMISVNQIFGDDVVNYDLIRIQLVSPLQQVTQMYYTWASRVLINFVMYTMYKPAFIVWKILNGLILTGLLWTIYYLFLSRSKPAVIWFYCMSFCLCNWPMLLTSAGWIATSVTYLWPIAALFLLFIPLKPVIAGNSEPVSPRRIILYGAAVPLAFYAANLECNAVALGIVSAAFFGYLYCSGKRRGQTAKDALIYCTILFVVAVISLVFIMQCPGNKSRMILETNTWYPYFSELSYIQQTALGLVALWHYIAVLNYPVFTLSTLMLAIVICRRDTPVVYKTIALIPVTAALLFGFLRHNITSLLIPRFEGRFHNGVLGRLPDFEQYDSYIKIAPVACIAFFLFCYLLSFYIAFKNSAKTLLFLLLLCTGIASQMMMGFSPTVFASSVRTSTLLCVIISIVAAAVFQRWTEKSREVPFLFLYGVGVVTLTSYAHQFAGVLK